MMLFSRNQHNILKPSYSPQKVKGRTSLGVQWLRIHLAMQGTQI